MRLLVYNNFAKVAKENLLRSFHITNSLATNATLLTINNFII
jgi:hypothetical protein